MLDQSVVISKGSSQRGGVLSPAVPEVIIDGGTAGATVTFVSGVCATATIDNSYVPGTYATAANPLNVATGTRRVLKQGGADHVGFTVAFA